MLLAAAAAAAAAAPTAAAAAGPASAHWRVVTVLTDQRLVPGGGIALQQLQGGCNTAASATRLVFSSDAVNRAVWAFNPATCALCVCAGGVAHSLLGVAACVA